MVDVTAAGADPDGSQPITDLVSGLAANDTVLEFPEGVYRIGALEVSRLENFGMRAKDGADVRLVPTARAHELGPVLLTFTDMQRFLLSGFTLDYRQPGHGGMVYVLGTGPFEVSDITTRGQYPPDVSGYRFEVVRPSSTAVVRNLVARGGSREGSDSVGIYVGRNHAGELRVEDCEIANFPNNGIYASSPGRQDAFSGANGPVHVRGGLYANNNVSNVRLGSSGSTARDVTVRVDRVPPAYSHGLNVRGIRIRARQGQIIENCEVSITTDLPRSFGGIVFHPDAGTGTVRDTRVRIDATGVPAVNVLEPNHDERGPTLERLEITGSAATENTVDVQARDGTRIRDSTIDQTGHDRSGIRFKHATDCIVENSEISVTGDPIVLDESQVVRRNNVFRTPTPATPSDTPL
ncbi:MAG: hypothetical protein ABEJ89_08845 [Haloarculaceae archaeon]